MKNEAAINISNHKSEAEFIAILEEFCTFPGPYMFKVITYASDEAAAEIARAADSVLGYGHEALNLTTRPSKKGSYVSVSIEPRVESPRQVLDVYAALRKLDGIITIF
jgi:putative lipoic acid-binding regulatory protein